MPARCSLIALAMLALAGCQSRAERDFAYGPPEAVARAHQAALACGIHSVTTERVAATAILRIDAAAPEHARTCLHDWIVAHERDVRFPPKL